MKESNKGYWMTAILGNYYKLYNKVKSFKLIKTSPKGFNLLDEETNKCIFSNPIVKELENIHLPESFWNFLK